VARAVAEAENCTFPLVELGQTMIRWQFAVPIVLGAAALAACMTYFAFPSPPQPIEANQRIPPPVSKATGREDLKLSSVQTPGAEDGVTAYQRAAEAILKRAQNAKAAADEPPLITGRIPLPRPRPLPRP